MRNRLYILMVMLTVSISSALAQVIVTGTVADAIEPLMMVNVVEVDETGRFVEATTTDMNGNFSLRIKNTNDKLQISYIGYKTEILTIGDRRVFNIVMKDENLIEEIVINAVKKKNTGGLDIRSKAKHDEWQKMLSCDVLYVNGADSVEENFEKVKKALLK